MAEIGVPAFFVFFVAFIIIAALNESPNDFEKTRTTFATVETTLKLYRARHGAYPTTAVGLKGLVSEQLLDEIPKDGWGGQLGFESDGNRFEITSLGADKAPGGTGINADLHYSGKEGRMDKGSADTSNATANEKK